MAERLSTDNERGFTIVEVLVAIVLLLIGVLGVVKMIDTANAVTDNTKAREGAISLSRQILEDARTVDYSHLDTTTAGNPLQTDLQAIVGADVNASKSGWQIRRRGIEFDVSLFACVFDDAQDGIRLNNSGATYCPGSPTPVNPATDRNPDDFRRVEVAMTWDLGPQEPTCRGQTTQSGGAASVANGQGLACVQESELIANPTGGLGPSIKDIAVVYTGVDGTGSIDDSVSANGGADKGAIESGTKMGFDITTSSPADKVVWSADDGVSGGTATRTDTAGVKWSFNWTYPVAPNPPLNDGPHTVTIQAFLVTLAGRPKTLTQAFNRFVPAAPTTTAPAIGVDSRVTPIVEINWNQNSDNDLGGYAAYEETTNDQLLHDSSPAPFDRFACSDVAQLSCFDPNPPSSGTAVKYYIVPFDTPWTNVPTPLNPAVYAPDCSALSGCWTCPTMTAPASPSLVAPFVSTTRPGCASTPLTVNITTGLLNPGPTWSPSSPCFLQTTNGAGFPQLDWTNFTANDSDNVIFYRIYRDPADLTTPAYSSRYARTSSEVFVDQEPGSGSHTYAVTAVDSKYQESPVALNKC